MSYQRFTYTFNHECGCKSSGITKAEYMAAHALTGLVKVIPEDICADSGDLAERAYYYAEETQRLVVDIAGDPLWSVRAAFPTNHQEGTYRDRFDFLGLTPTDWIASKLLTGVTRTLSLLSGDYFVKPYSEQTMAYTQEMLSLLGQPTSKTAYPYRQQNGLTFRDRVETRVLAEVITCLPEPMKPDEIPDVIRAARALTENEPEELQGNTIGRWFAERMAPWLIRGLAPHTTAGHIYRFAFELSDKLSLNPANPAMPTVRYHEGGREPISISRGLTIRGWLAGTILGDIACRMSTILPWDDAVDRALAYADAVVTEYAAQGFEVDPHEPAYPLQIARCRGENSCTYEHANGLHATLWLAGKLMGSLARRDIPDSARAAKYAIYQAHRLFVESAKREQAAIASFEPAVC